MKPALLLTVVMIGCQAGCQASMGYRSRVPKAPALPETLRPKAGAAPAPEQAIPLSAGAYAQSSFSSRTADLDGVSNDAGQQHVSLQSVVARAWEHSPEVLLAEARLEQARGRTQERDGELFPTVSIGAGAGYLYGREVSNFGDTRDVSFARFDPGVALIYRLNPGARTHAARAARRDQDAAAFDVEDSRRRAVQSAMQAYHDLAITRASTDISRMLIDDAESFLRIAEAKAASGLASEADVALAQLELTNAKRTLLGARARWAETSATLAALLRWDPAVLLAPAEDHISSAQQIVIDDADALANEALASRPDLQAARARVQAAAQERAAVRWDALGPDLALEVRERVLATDDRAFGDTTLAQAFIGWSFSFADIGRARQARARLAEQSIALEVASERVRAEVHASKARIDALARSLTQARNGLEAAEQHHRIQLARFEAGTALGIEVITAQNAVARARLELVDTALRYRAEQLDLLAQIGHLTPAS